MKIEILKMTMCGGRRVKAGAVVEASDRDAAFLVNTRRAKRVSAAPIEESTEELTEQDDQSPGPKKGKAPKKSPTNKMVDAENLSTK